MNYDRIFIDYNTIDTIARKPCSTSLRQGAGAHDVRRCAAERAALHRREPRVRRYVSTNLKLVWIFVPDLVVAPSEMFTDFL